MNYQSLGNDFHKLVIDFGETINLSVINGEDTQTYSVKACLENATQAAYNLVDRAYLVKGNMERPDGLPFERLTGMYFTRESDNSTYLLNTAIPEPVAPTLCFIYANKTNATINILKKTKSSMDDRDQWGNLIEKFTVREADVPIYWYTTLRSDKIQNNGKLDQTIYAAYVPARYSICKGDKITKKDFVNGGYNDEVFTVESVETAMVTTIPETGQLLGIVSIQLTKNINKVLVEDGESEGETEI